VDLMARHRTSGLVVGAVVFTALAMSGCSSGTSGTGSSASSPSATGASAATAVVIDGQDQKVSGPVSCTTTGDNVAIGIGGATSGIGAVVTTADPPAVHSVGLGSLNGVMLGYSDAATNQGTVQATRSGKSYTITGTATGVDTSNPQQPITKPFELQATCP
jgi:ipoprotein LpqH